MDDKQIVSLYWERDEAALELTQDKYGQYLCAIARNILGSDEDAEECVNDTYARAWDSIPPQSPSRLGAFLGKITRNLALDRVRSDGAKKRGEGRVELVLDELAECLPDGGGNVTDDVLLKDMLERFLRSLPEQTVRVFMRRYWYMSSVSEIAAEYRLSENRVKVILFRARNKLKAFLEKEGMNL